MDTTPEAAKSPIQAYREANGLTQQELADILDVSQTLVANVENGARPITPERAIDWESRIGIHRAILRPDIFGGAPQPSRTTA